LFPRPIIVKMVLHMKDNKHPSFILINCLEYITITINYCMALVILESKKSNNDPNPVMLCITDNTSALNWTIHTCKKSIMGQALAHVFCGLLIGSIVGVNAKWISTAKNCDR
jgi:hypothetical protein